MEIDLEDLSYNDRYDATIAKGLCFECGQKVEPYWCEVLSEWFTSIWCSSCNFGLDAGDAMVIGDQ
jgi:hypothetical protein